MTELRFSVAATGVQQYRTLARKLRKAGQKDLRAKLRKRISEAGQEVVRDIQDAVRHVHVTSTRTSSSTEFLNRTDLGNRKTQSGGGRGSQQRREDLLTRAKSKRSREAALRRGGIHLREAIADATRVQITAKGVKITVNSARLPEKQRGLPKYLDRPKGWRHPVFADRERWVTEKGEPYFGVTIKKKSPAFRAAILQAVADIRAELER